MVGQIELGRRRLSALDEDQYKALSEVQKAYREEFRLHAYDLQLVQI